MLKKLVINNYAIIDHIEVEFGPGLNILTGETGAGKSIIVDAVNLLLGERMHSGILRKGARKGYVEGYFDAASLTGMEKEAAANLLDGADAGIIRIKREISGSGGSKVFINGLASTVQNLKLGITGLIDMHGQHQHQSLLYADRYFEIIDRYGGSMQLAANVKEAYQSISGINDQIAKLKQQQRELDEKRDFLEFQLNEISSADPQHGEEDELEKEWTVLQNAEKIASITRQCYDILYDSDSSAAANIRRAVDLVTDLSDMIDEAGEVKEDIQGALVSVEETAAILLKLGSRIEHNPDRLEEISQRLSLLKQLQKKYRTDHDGLISKAEEIRELLRSDESLSEEIEAAENRLAESQKRFGELSMQLSGKRKSAASKLQKAILQRLKSLGMEKSLFEVTVEQKTAQSNGQNSFVVTTKSGHYTGTPHGIDEIGFRIATGKSERLMAVSKIASGGEMSRIMLAIKSALMKADRIPVLIFDEIDSGISGRIASAVGRELQRLAEFHQLLCITHLPQIASLAERHYAVEKTEINGRIVTRINLLTDAERKNAIAGLLAGDKITDQHLRSAEDLLNEKK